MVYKAETMCRFCRKAGGEAAGMAGNRMEGKRHKDEVAAVFGGDHAEQ